MSYNSDLACNNLKFLVIILTLSHNDLLCHNFGFLCVIILTFCKNIKFKVIIQKTFSHNFQSISDFYVKILTFYLMT